MENMDWMLFWTAFGAIGGTLGAFATFIAVAVALWQTKYSYKKKLKVSFYDKAQILNISGTDIIELIALTTINIGNRDVIIDGWGLKLKDGNEARILSDLPMKNVSRYVQEALKTSLPHLLSVEHSVTFYYDKTLFLQLIPQYCKKGELTPNKPITFFVVDSTGRKYYVKSKKKAKEYGSLS